MITEDNILHLSLEASISILYAPEIRFSASGNGLVGKKIKIDGHIDGSDLYICQAKGCSPDQENCFLLIHEQNFEFILAWKDKKNSELYTGRYKGLECCA